MWYDAGNRSEEDFGVTYNEDRVTNGNLLLTP